MAQMGGVERRPAPGGQDGIGGAQQVGRGVHQGAVQVENQGRGQVLERGHNLSKSRLESRQYSVANRHFIFFGRELTGNHAKAAIILAAGPGTRMKSAMPKVLHKVAGLPILGHVIAALRGAGVERIVVVTSPAGEAVRAYAEGLGCRKRRAGPAARHRPCRRGGGERAGGFRAARTGGHQWRHAAGDGGDDRRMPAGAAHRLALVAFRAADPAPMAACC